jgi:hypothetical protein
MSAGAPARAALLALSLLACATSEPVVDLTPWVWTWSQADLDGVVIRYAHPDESPPDAGAGDAPASDALGFTGVASETRLAVHRYGCASAERAQESGCSVELEIRLLVLDPSLAAATLTAWRERRAGAAGQDRRVLEGIVHDARGREWLRRALELGSGAALQQYSRPLDARRVLVVSSGTSRAPDRVAARDLARDAIGRLRIEAEPAGAR